MSDPAKRPSAKSASSKSTSAKSRKSGRSGRTQTPEQRRRQAIITAIGLAVVGVLFLVTWLINNHHSADTPSTAAASASATKTTGTKTTGTKTGKKSNAARTTTASGQVPARVTKTLKLIDAGEWPEAANAPGTRGGITFRNSEKRLPATDSTGKRITYQEWDVNPKQQGRSRDAERIVTGSDGSAWYTSDHYDSFIRIRGPNS